MSGSKFSGVLGRIREVPREESPHPPSPPQSRQRSAGHRASAATPTGAPAPS